MLRTTTDGLVALDAQGKVTVRRQTFDILEAIGDGFFALDGEDRFSYVNARAAQMWGHPREELLGKTMWEVFPDLVGTDFYFRLQQGCAERGHFVSKALLSGTAVEIDMHPCAGGVCVYFRMTSADGQQPASVKELVFAAREEERQRIARDLHDSAGQVLAALAMGLRAIADARSLAAAKDRAEQLQTMAHRVANELSYLSRGVYAANIGGFTLGPALRQLCADFAETFAVDVRLLAARIDSVQLEKTARVAVYRIIQEALSNVARHSRASHVRVAVRLAAGTLHVKIVDDGRGFTLPAGDEDSTRMPHMGLRTMRERAELLGGTLTVNSTTGHGTCVLASIPVKNPVRQAEAA